MPRYSYKAYDDKGGRLAGEIESETREAALEALMRQGRYALELVEGGSAAPALPWWQREVFGSRRLSQQNIALLTRELATLVKAELPIDEALRSAVGAGAASTLEVGAGRFDPREASRLAVAVEVTELEPVVS